MSLPREPRARVVTVHPLLWVVEPLESEPTFTVRPMFGGKAIYLHGRFVLFLAAKAPPWRGVLVPTERSHQPSLRADRPALQPHTVLPKWLYLSEETATFERDAAWLVTRILQRDPRIGIEPRAQPSRPPAKPRSSQSARRRVTPRQPTPRRRQSG